MQRQVWRRGAIAAVAALVAAGAGIVGAPPARAQGDGPATEAERALQEHRRATDERIAELERRLEAMAEVTAEAELQAILAEGEALARADDRDRDDGRLSIFGASQQFLTALNPRITVFGDAVGRFETTSNRGELDDRFSVREVEFDFRAAVDPYASAVVIIALEEDEPNDYHLEVEEAYITLDSLPLRLRAQIGRFQPALGSINRLHNHDLPWTFRPLPNRDFLGGGEALSENGARLAWLSPPLGPLTFEASAAVLSGESRRLLGGTEGSRPAYKGRLEAFTDLGALGYLSLGGSYLYGTNDDGNSRATQLWVADATYRIQRNQYSSLVLFGEAIYMEKQVPGDTERAYGWWAGAQVQPNLGRLWAPLRHTYLGVRYDYSTYDEQIEDRDHWALGTYVSYYTTEFLRFRLGYEHHERSSTFFGEPDERKLVFQLTFVFGSHPAEPFWFNR